MNLAHVPLLQTARVVTRYCLPQASSDLPHVTHQLDAFLDTFSADWTIVKAYKYTESLRCAQYLAARELPEDQDSFYKRWLLNRTAELAATRGDLQTLQCLMEVYLPVEDLNCVAEAAAAFGHLDILQWLYNRHLERVHFGGSEMCGALERKHQQVVTWLREHAVPAPEHRNKVLRSAAKAGNLHIVKWLCEEFGLDATKSLQVTIDGCNWETARWIIERFDLSGVRFSMYFPAMHGELSFLKYLSSRNMTFPNDTIEVAAAHGHVDVVKWLYRCPNVKAMARAAHNGHLNVVQWLCNARGGDVNSDETSLTPVFASAAEYGHLNVLQWLHTHCSGNCGARLINDAASNGHFDIVKYLHEHRSEGCTTYAMDVAAGAGYLEIVKWLNDHRSEGCSTYAMDSAAQHGHFDVVQWLHNNRTEGCTSLAMDGAADHGHLDIVKWLHENRSEGCTTVAMDKAARYGHLKVVKWLHEHRTEGCTKRAMNDAAKYGRLNIIKWLHVNHNERCHTADAIRNGHFDIVLYLRLHCEEDFYRHMLTNDVVRVPLELQQWLLADCGELLNNCQFKEYNMEFGN